MIIHYEGQFNTAALQEQAMEKYPSLDFQIFPLAWTGEVVTSMDVQVPDGTSRAAVDAFIAGHNYLQPTKADQLRAGIVTMAQSTVGVRLSDLTAAQIKSLMACLLYRAGGVDLATMAVRPLGEWL